MDYAALLALAKRRGCRVDELLALSRNSDPFFVGQPARTRDGEWFAEVWDLLGQPSGAHLRRLHYQLVSGTTPPRLPDDSAYENTVACWVYLNQASRNARYLGLIDPRALTDHRSAPPALFAASRTAPTPAWTVDRLGSWGTRPPLPTIDTDMGWASDLAMPVPSVSGYGYDPADQPYHLEVWIEKSTMDDVLVPICRHLGIDLVTGVGYLSVTRVVEMLERVRSHGKPARIFYISDFDPSGEGMPIQVSRQSEFWLPKLAPGADLKLDPLALTGEQARHYGLPRTPIKAGHLQKDDFEARHGAGAVELDALEALRPGELRRLVEQAIEPYIDRELGRRLALASAEASRIVVAGWEAATAEERRELADIDDEATGIVATYQEELEQLAARLDEDLEPFSERLSAVWQKCYARSQPP
jgi:hypothetical protein